MDQHDLPKAPKARRAYTGAAPLLLKPETARAVLRDVARAAYRERREARILGDEARLAFLACLVEEHAGDYPGASPGFASYEWTPVAELLRVDRTHAPGVVTRALIATVRRACDGSAESSARLTRMYTDTLASARVLRLPLQEEPARPWYVEMDGGHPVAFVFDAQGKPWAGVLAATPCQSCHGPRTWDHRAQGARCAQCEAPAVEAPIATVTTAELTWIRDLPEVGPAISSLADQEAALLAEVRAIEERRVAAEGRLAALRSSAPARVRAAGWTEAEIGQAKGRYASGGDRFGR